MRGVVGIILTFVFFPNSLAAQHSSYFYRMPYKKFEITSEEHALYEKRVCFKPADDDRDRSNVLKESDLGECQEFKPAGVIQQHVYLEHPLSYYYEKYLADPAKKKSDWDYKPLVQSKEPMVCGFLVFVYKINGAAVWSSILMLDKFAVHNSHLEYLEMWRFREGDANPYEYYVKGSEYPLVRYLRDIGKPGRYKVEVEVYPGKLDASKDTDRSDEIICKGEFVLTVSAQDAAVIAKSGGAKGVPKTARFVLYNNRLIEDK